MKYPRKWKDIFRLNRRYDQKEDRTCRICGSLPDWIRVEYDDYDLAINYFGCGCADDNDLNMGLEYAAYRWALGVRELLYWRGRTHELKKPRLLQRGFWLRRPRRKNKNSRNRCSTTCYPYARL